MPSPSADAAIVPAAADGADVLIDAGFVLPDQRAGFGIERKHIVIAGGDIHHAVFHDRRRFERIFGAEPRAKMRHPRAFEILHIVRA